MKLDLQGQRASHPRRDVWEKVMIVKMKLKLLNTQQFTDMKLKVLSEELVHYSVKKRN